MSQLPFSLEVSLPHTYQGWLYLVSESWRDQASLGHPRQGIFQWAGSVPEIDWFPAWPDTTYWNLKFTTQEKHFTFSPRPQPVPLQWWRKSTPNFWNVALKERASCQTYPLCSVILICSWGPEQFCLLWGNSSLSFFPFPKPPLPFISSHFSSLELQVGTLAEFLTSLSSWLHVYSVYLLGEWPGILRTCLSFNSVQRKVAGAIREDLVWLALPFYTHTYLRAWPIELPNKHALIRQ